jgi:hypothetical protein
MVEAMAYNSQGYSLPMKDALNKAIEIEERAKYGRDLAAYQELGGWPAKHRKTW